MRLWAALLATLWAGAIRADAQRERASAGGYFRVMTRPDFQGGDSKLGASNLYGRLLNEGPWAALELRLDLLQAPPGTYDTWTSVHTKIEGGSFWSVDTGGGQLARYMVTRMVVQAGNLLVPRITWRLGTLYSSFGDLGLYDLQPAAIFSDPSGRIGDTVGLAARYDGAALSAEVGLGDAGYFLKGNAYNTVLTAGAHARVRLGEHLEVGAGAQGYVEPQVRGNRFAPHQTPEITYEGFYRGEAVAMWLAEHPGQEDLFPHPDPTQASSYKLVAYLGFGKLGLLRWNNLFAQFRRLHPDNFVSESFAGRDYTLYVKELTDERYALVVGNEMQLNLIAQRLDVVWAALYGRDENRDNRIAAGEDNRDYVSTVLRAQVYLTDSVHVLLESSAARERSRNGNLWREHFDSIFLNRDGLSDTRGLELGDSDQRFTWQLKGGLVLNPLGVGIYTRPSLRFLYGLQYSNVHNAFGNSFVETQEQYQQLAELNDRHWHSLVAIEVEGWF